ncbi:MAG: uracil phosphoribosyltransferase [Verrucomicrobiota bacterium]
MSFAVAQPGFAQLSVLAHPLAADAVARMRDAGSDREAFALALEQLSCFLAAEATRGLAARTVEVTTPMETVGQRVLAQDVVVVPILRAGLALVEGFQRLVPGATVCHLGVARNEETLQPEAYLNRLVPLENQRVVVVDPMLATGGSASWAIHRCQEQGAREIQFCCALAAPEGVRRLERDHPEVPVIAAALDRELNSQGFILPGLGDAGDRYFGT